MKPRKISYLITMGDSLSDRGTFYHRYLFGFIPMKMLSSLQEGSPDGRFTNGFVWSDHVSAMIANEFVIKELKEKCHLDSTDIADGIINHTSHIGHSLQGAYKLDNHQSVTFNGNNLVRNYNEAGLTAHDHSWNLGRSPSLFLYRNMVSTLGGMLQKLLAYDEIHALSPQQKAETLIIEWSGANDLIFVNERPSKECADRAILARLENLKQLIQHGYRHFVLFNLPDLSLTPRYQNMSAIERDNAHECSAYFNEKLANLCKDMSSTNPECSIEEFDVFDTFTEGYNNPTKYGFDAEKIKTPYLQSADFKLRRENKAPLSASSAKGYMFWDDLHPTAYLHALIGERFYNKFRNKFDFCSSKHNDKKETPPQEYMSSTGKLLVGGIAAAAAVIGLRKASSLLGISSQVTAAGLGLVTLGFFAQKPVENLMARAKNFQSVGKVSQTQGCGI